MSEDYEEEYQSGPFCRHWGILGDCDENCAKCGHSCNRHDRDDNECDECECKEFADEDDANTLKSRAEKAFTEE